MEAAEKGRELLPMVPMTRGVIAYRCSKCGCSRTVSVSDMLTRPNKTIAEVDKWFAGHRCADYGSK